MNYSNQYCDSISTVQLSPFGEGQWNRIVTYSPIYVHWTELAMMPSKRTSKPTSAKRNLGNSFATKTRKLNDEILLDELHRMRRDVVGPTLKEEGSYHEARFLEEENDERRASLTDEYQRYTDFFYQTRESFYHQQHHTKPQVMH
jgi:hypothetical protein